MVVPWQSAQSPRFSEGGKALCHGRTAVPGHDHVEVAWDLGSQRSGSPHSVYGTIVYSSNFSIASYSKLQ